VGSLTERKGRVQKETESIKEAGREAHRKRDDALSVDEPTLPLLLVDADAFDAFDRGLVQRVGRGQPDGDLHRLVVDFVAGGDFFAFGVDFDDERLRFGVLGRDPVLYGGELGGDNGGRYL